MLSAAAAAAAAAAVACAAADVASFAPGVGESEVEIGVVDVAVVPGADPDVGDPSADEFPPVGDRLLLIELPDGETRGGESVRCKTRI